MSDIEYLKNKARQIRRDLTEVCISHGGHLASSLSCVDILVALYHGKLLSISPETATERDRDRFILSKGHAETALYTILTDMGFISNELLENEYRQGGCKLGGHPSHKINGVEWSTGSLGHGIGVASGQALTAKLDNKQRHHFVLTGDSECTEGSIWEGAIFASKHNLDNLTVIIDRNHLGVLESTEEFTALNPLKEKWESFGWQTYTCNGHDISELITTLAKAKNADNNRPTAVIAETVKGKGIPFVENVALWHVLALTNPEQIAQARNALASGEKE